MPEYRGPIIDGAVPFDIVDGPFFEILIAPPPDWPQQVSIRAYVGPNLLDTYFGNSMAHDFGLESDGELWIRVRSDEAGADKYETNPLRLDVHISGLDLDLPGWRDHIVIGWTELLQYFTVAIQHDGVLMTVNAPVVAGGPVDPPCRPY